MTELAPAAFAPSVPARFPGRSRPLPAWPSCWYAVGRSADLRRGGVTAGEIAGRPYVLYRSATGALAALDAHCPHMGTHLGHGQVVGERLRCPLHHWTVDPSGRCRGRGAREDHRSRPWPVAESQGLVFLHPDPSCDGDAPPPPPAPEAPERYTWITGRPVTLTTDWRAMVVHGFDLHHLRAVHHRVVVDIEELGERDGALRLRYVSRVDRGGGLSDWAMKRISGNRIRVRQSCHGSIVVVESRVGDRRTAAVLGLTRDGDRVRAFSAFGAERGGLLAPLRRLATRWLFSSFLRRDFAVIEGIRLSVDGVDDPGVRAVAAYLRSLPELDPGAAPGGDRA